MSCFDDDCVLGIDCLEEIDKGGIDGLYENFRYFKTKNKAKSGLLIESSKFSRKLLPFELLETIQKQQNVNLLSLFDVNNVNDDINDLIEGDAVIVDSIVGIIRYLGPIYLNVSMDKKTKELYYLYIGIECINEIESGGHDGWYRDFRYFQTKDKANSGLLIKASKFEQKLSPFQLLETIKKQKIAIDKSQKKCKKDGIIINRIRVSAEVRLH